MICKPEDLGDHDTSHTDAYWGSDFERHSESSNNTRQRSADSTFYVEWVRPFYKEIEEERHAEITVAFKQLDTELNALRKLKKNWDSYEADVPNEVAIKAAKKILAELRSTHFRPDRILPSAEGGVGIVFARNQRYAEFECFNDGDVLIGMSDRTSNPVIRQVNLNQPLASEITKIREFIQSEDSETDAETGSEAGSEFQASGTPL